MFNIFTKKKREEPKTDPTVTRMINDFCFKEEELDKIRREGALATFFVQTYFDRRNPKFLISTLFEYLHGFNEFRLAHHRKVWSIGFSLFTINKVELYPNDYNFKIFMDKIEILKINMDYNGGNYPTYDLEIYDEKYLPHLVYFHNYILKFKYEMEQQKKLQNREYLDQIVKNLTC